MPNQPDELTALVSRLVGAPVTLVFGLVLLVHIPAGLTCVVRGIPSNSRTDRVARVTSVFLG